MRGLWRISVLKRPAVLCAGSTTRNTSRFIDVLINFLTIIHLVISFYHFHVDISESNYLVISYAHFHLGTFLLHGGLVGGPEEIEFCQYSVCRSTCTR